MILSAHMGKVWITWLVSGLKGGIEIEGHKARLDRRIAMLSRDACWWLFFEGW